MSRDLCIGAIFPTFFKFLVPNYVFSIQFLWLHNNVEGSFTVSISNVSGFE